MVQDNRPPLDPANVNIVFDENRDITDGEKLPVQAMLKVLRYRTIKKSQGFGWWSAVVLVEDKGDKQICFYRWRKKGSEWKRDKKLTFRSHSDWGELKDAVECFLKELE